MALGGGAVRQWPWAPLAVASGSFGPGRGLVREASMKPRSCSSAESDEGGNTDAALGVCSRGLHKARESRSRTGQAGRRWVGSRGPGIDMGCGNAFCPSHSPAETPSTRTCVTEPRACPPLCGPRGPTALVRGHAGHRRRGRGSVPADLAPIVWQPATGQHARHYEGLIHGVRFAADYTAGHAWKITIYAC